MMTVTTEMLDSSLSQSPSHPHLFTPPSYKTLCSSPSSFAPQPPPFFHRSPSLLTSVMQSAHQPTPLPSFLDPLSSLNRQQPSNIWAPRAVSSDTTWPRSLDLSATRFADRDVGQPRPALTVDPLAANPRTNEDVFGPVGFPANARNRGIGAIGDGRKNSVPLHEDRVSYFLHHETRLYAEAASSARRTDVTLPRLKLSCLFPNATAFFASVYYEQHTGPIPGLGDLGSDDSHRSLSCDWFRQVELPL